MTSTPPPTRARQAASQWGPLRAEFRPAVLPAAVLGAAVAAVATTRAVLLYLDAFSRGTANTDANLLTLRSAPGALQSAAWHHASLLGLFFVALLGAVVLAGALESGTWPLMRLQESRVWLLMTRKLLAVLSLAVLSMGSTAVVLWTAMRVCTAMWQPDEPRSSVAPLVESTGTSGPTWGDALEAGGSTLLVLSGYAAIGAFVAAATRGVIAAAVLGAGPLTVTLPLVTTGFRDWTPHYWIAAWMEFPDGGQWQLYWWSSAPGSGGAGTAGFVLAVLSGGLLVGAWCLLRAERALSPRI
ncbi:hypothetical protein [Streptomyces alkaliphilus]|uniref:hypothetical protein n=1 Tax=Streptomyces alkaliphilus TaxID=1472722 RepID=UPI00117FC4A6|nr:hypothetical protein [Streptomyces alkaliphilus]MQS05670.1 hypothetical protein [Streptomyces alkaliphilus]